MCHDHHMTKAEAHHMDMHTSNIHRKHGETLQSLDACNIDSRFEIWVRVNTEKMAEDAKDS